MSAITLVEQRLIEIPDSRLLALSPDGGSIAVARPDGSDATELCIHEVATLAERVCADLSDLESGLWHEMVVWSPDSQWLAFAELWPQYFAGGGLWLMDASTGALTNLLDDSALALYPTFTPDSTAVTFERTLIEDGDFASVDIATVPITGGEAVRLGDSERQASDVEHWGMAWSEDGSGLYVNLVVYADREASVLDPDSGIWVFGADGVNARQLLSVTGLDDWPPSIMAVSPRGEHAARAPAPHVPRRWSIAAPSWMACRVPSSPSSRCGPKAPPVHARHRGEALPGRVPCCSRSQGAHRSGRWLSAMWPGATRRSW